MIRASLDADSAQAMMLVSYSKGLAFQRRTATGGLARARAAPRRRLPLPTGSASIGPATRSRRYQSVDGLNWALVGTDTFSMGSTVYVGLGVSSHTTSSAATAKFDHVSVTNSSEG